MNPAKQRLLIHHHDVAYVDELGEIWLSSTIGRWVAALADHFQSIGLLLHESTERRAKQDTAIARSNVTLHSLGPPGHYWDRLPRMRRIRRMCQLASEQADGLLIRGYTPRQHVVWSHVNTRHKAFLLVCNPKQKYKFNPTPTHILAAIISWHREREYKRIVRRGTVLLANSPTYVPEIEAIADRPAQFVPTNTIQLGEFAPMALRPLSVPVRLLYVGRLCFRKGLRELLYALARLRDQGRDCIVDMVAGHAEPEYSQLCKLANQLGIADAINWHDFVPFGPKLFAHYLSADVFVLPTYTEGFPHVLWEAAANCTPIVTTAVGGIPALFEHDRDALLIEPKNVRALVGAINCLLEDNPLRTCLVESAYTLAQSYSVESCGKRLAATLSQEWK